MRALPALIVITAVLALALGTGTSQAGPIIITVNSTAGDNDLTCHHINPGPGQDCTISEAISSLALYTDGLDIVIAFSPVAFSFPNTVILQQALPVIPAYRFASFTIDGTAAFVRLQPVGSGMDVAGMRINGGTAPLTVKNIQFTDWEREGLYICGGLNGGLCPNSLGSVMLDDISSIDNDLAGIAVRGNDIASVTLNNVYAEGNGNNNVVPSNGVWIQAAGALTNVTVNGGEVFGNTLHGLELAGNSVSDSSVHGLSAHTNNQDGLLAIGTTVYSITVDGLMAYNNGSIGANFFAAGQLFYINLTGGSSLYNNGVYGAQFAGGAATSSIGVSDNTFDQNYAAINVNGYDLASIQIQDNMITGSFGNQVQVTGHGASGTGNFISGNEITGGAGDGIIVFGPEPASVRISQNRTHSNGKLGINLQSDSDPLDGVTPNDAGDGDTGPNDYLNFPVITGVVGTDLVGTACANCLVEMFIADPPDPSVHGEGNTFIREGGADGDGHFAISLCDFQFFTGLNVTTTATDFFGNTSEFSLNFALPAAVFNCATPSPSPGPTPSPTPSPTASPAPSNRIQGDLDCSGVIDARDGLIAVLNTFGFGILREVGCPLIEFGSPKFGDVNCDGVVDELDGLAILAYKAGAPLPPVGGCTPLGSAL